MTNIFLDLRVTNTLGNSDPIDVLQSMYNDWILENTSHELGDINQDSELDILDIVGLVYEITSGTNSDAIIVMGDMNQDSSIDVLDIVILVDTILNI